MFKFIYLIHQHILPDGRADLTASAALQPTRGSSLQLREPLPCPPLMLGWGGGSRLVNNPDSELSIGIFTFQATQACHFVREKP